MDINNLYTDLLIIATKLYQNEVEGLVQLNEKSYELKNVLERIVSEFPECIQSISQVVAKLNEAAENGDKLLLADVIYYEICGLIKEYATENGIELPEAIEAKQQIVEVSDSCMRDWYDRNIENLIHANINQCKELVKYCEEFNIEDDETIATDLYGNMMVLKNQRWWGLNSFYNRNKAAELGIIKIKESGYISILFVFGLGNMDYINQILNIIPSDTSLMIYEPNQKIFAMNMHYSDMDSILQRRNVFLFVEGINAQKMGKYIYTFSDKLISKYSYTFISPGYDVIYKKELENKIEECNEAMNKACVIDNTIEQKSEYINYDRIMNIRLLFHSVFLSDLKRKLQESIDLEKVPAIIVAAGPSLDKNIHLLKKAKGRAFILAVDSSVRMLLKYNIEPDAVVSIDPNKEGVLFQNELMERSPLFYCIHSTYDNISDLKGTKIFCSGGIDSDMLLKALGKTEDAISGGGCVANTAISIALYLGFKNIIAVGFDLAFTDRKIHASVVYDDGGIGDEQSEEYTYVEGQNGEKLLTYKNFMLYKNWIEKSIKEYSDQITFIDATEGGALIEGTVCMTLENSIDQYCKECADIQKYILETPVYCEKLNLGDGREYLEKFIEDCDTVKQSFFECYSLYKGIITCSNSKKLGKKLQRINQINTEVNKLFVMEIIKDYAALEVDTQLDKMYEESATESQSSWDDVKIIADNGMKISQIYMESAQKAKALFKISVDNISNTL